MQGAGCQRAQGSPGQTLVTWICVCVNNGALPAAAEGLWTSRVLLGAVHPCASADYLVCADLHVHLSLYAFYMCVSVCLPTGNPRRAGECGAVTASPLSGHWISHKNTERIIYICFTLEMGLVVRNLHFSPSFSWIITTPAEGFANPASGMKSLPHSVIIIST